METGSQHNVSQEVLEDPLKLNSIYSEMGARAAKVPTTVW